MTRLADHRINRRQVLAGGVAATLGLSSLSLVYANVSGTGSLTEEKSSFHNWTFPIAHQQAISNAAIQRRQTSGLVSQRILRNDEHLTIFEEWQTGQWVPDFPSHEAKTPFMRLPL